MERGEGEFTLHPLLALDIRAPGSQAFRLELNGTSSLPGSPVCRWQVTGLLGVCDPVNQFLY